MKTITSTPQKAALPDTTAESPAQKALRTAKWARIMTKWLVSHSSKGGVQWQLVTFNGKAGQESAGIVDMIAIRKNHAESALNAYRGDLFEIILIQVKGGGAKFPSEKDVNRLVSVKEHHRASKVVLTEWKPGKKLSCYLLPDTKNAVSASEIFGTHPRAKKLQAKAAGATPA